MAAAFFAQYGLFGRSYRLFARRFRSVRRDCSILFGHNSGKKRQIRLVFIYKRMHLGAHSLRDVFAAAVCPYGFVPCRVRVGHKSGYTRFRFVYRFAARHKARQVRAHTRGRLARLCRRQYRYAALYSYRYYKRP